MSIIWHNDSAEVSFLSNCKPDTTISEMLTRLLEILAEKENKDILATHGLLAVWLGPVLIVLIDNLEDIEVRTIFI